MTAASIYHTALQQRLTLLLFPDIAAVHWQVLQSVVSLLFELDAKHQSAIQLVLDSNDDNHDRDSLAMTVRKSP